GKAAGLFDKPFVHPLAGKLIVPKGCHDLTAAENGKDTRKNIQRRKTPSSHCIVQSNSPFEKLGLNGRGEGDHVTTKAFGNHDPKCGLSRCHLEPPYRKSSFWRAHLIEAMMHSRGDFLSTPNLDYE